MTNRRESLVAESRHNELASGAAPLECSAVPGPPSVPLSMAEATTKAVFLSYASQDVAAALRICNALRSAGVEVWFDQSELVGGDQWDQKIRGQVKACDLFVPVISGATQARLEGYFRLEWKLAAQRTHTMADAKPFLLPVVIDTTGDAEAHVPEEFRAVQWTRLPAAKRRRRFARGCRNYWVVRKWHGLSSPCLRPNPRAGKPVPRRRRVAASRRRHGSRLF